MALSMERTPNEGAGWKHYYSKLGMRELAEMSVDNGATHATHLTLSDLTAKLDCPLQQPYTAETTSPPRPGPQRYLYATGPYALELWYPGDDIHLVCLTDNSASTFWSYVAEKLDREDLPQDDGVVADLTHGGKVWLHYCPLPRDFDPAAPRGNVLPRTPKSDRTSSSTTNNLLSLHDTWHLLKYLSKDASVFKRAYIMLRSFAQSEGIYSSNFGFLDADSLLWMLFQIIPSSISLAEDDDAHALFRVCLATYRHPPSLQTVHTPSGRKVFNPPRDIAHDASVTVASRFHAACSSPDHGYGHPAEPAQWIIRSYWAVALVHAECWAPRQRLTLQDQLVEQISSLPKAIHDKNLTNSAIAVWPYAFRPSDDEWIYLVGIEADGEDDHSLLRTEARFLGSAAKEIPEDEDSASQTKQPSEELVALLETYDFGLDNTIGRATARLCSPAEARELSSKYIGSVPVYDLAKPAHIENLDRNSTPESTNTAGTKFPTAAQALSRLRWDPSHAAQDYEVGYLDRFEGLKWLPLEQWGKATEDEEFVPEHRIRVLRRVGDGKVVWDREGRVCEF